MSDSIVRTTHLDGVPIHIEVDVGDSRSGTSKDGVKWETVHENAYGFIPMTTGGDGEEVDVYLGNEPLECKAVYCIEQIKGDKFDENKWMVGFPSEKAAVDAFLDHMPEEMFGGVTASPSVEQFKKLVMERKIASHRMKQGIDMAPPRDDSVDILMDKDELSELDDAVKQHNVNDESIRQELGDMAIDVADMIDEFTGKTAGSFEEGDDGSDLIDDDAQLGPTDEEEDDNEDDFGQLDRGDVYAGMFVEIDPVYGGGKGRVVDVAPSGSFVTVQLTNGREQNHHVSDLREIDYLPEGEDDGDMDDDEDGGLPLDNVYASKEAAHIKSKKSTKTAADHVEGYWPKIDREMASELRLTEAPKKGKEVWTPNGTGKVELVDEENDSVTVMLDSSGELMSYRTNRLRKIEAAIRPRGKTASDFNNGDTVALKPEFGKRGIILYLTPYQDYMVAWSGGSMQRINPDLLMKVSKRLVQDADALLEKYADRIHKTTKPGGMDDNVIMEALAHTDFDSADAAIKAAYQTVYGQSAGGDDLERIQARIEERNLGQKFQAAFLGKGAPSQQLQVAYKIAQPYGDYRDVPSPNKPPLDIDSMRYNPRVHTEDDLVRASTRLAIGAAPDLGEDDPSSGVVKEYIAMKLHDAMVPRDMIQRVLSKMGVSKIAGRIKHTADGMVGMPGDPLGLNPMPMQSAPMQVTITGDPDEVSTLLDRMFDDEGMDMDATPGEDNSALMGPMPEDEVQDDVTPEDGSEIEEEGDEEEGDDEMDDMFEDEEDEGPGPMASKVRASKTAMRKEADAFVEVVMPETFDTTMDPGPICDAPTLQEVADSIRSLEDQNCSLEDQIREHKDNERDLQMVLDDLANTVGDMQMSLNTTPPASSSMVPKDVGIGSPNLALTSSKTANAKKHKGANVFGRYTRADVDDTSLKAKDVGDSDAEKDFKEDWLELEQDYSGSTLSETEERRAAVLGGLNTPKTAAGRTSGPSGVDYDGGEDGEASMYQRGVVIKTIGVEGVPDGTEGIILTAYPYGTDVEIEVATGDRLTVNTSDIDPQNLGPSVFKKHPDTFTPQFMDPPPGGWKPTEGSKRAFTKTAPTAARFQREKTAAGTAQTMLKDLKSKFPDWEITYDTSDLYSGFVRFSLVPEDDLAIFPEEEDLNRDFRASMPEGMESTIKGLIPGADIQWNGEYPASLSILVKADPSSSEADPNLASKFASVIYANMVALGAPPPIPPAAHWKREKAPWEDGSDDDIELSPEEEKQVHEKLLKQFCRAILTSGMTFGMLVQGDSPYAPSAASGKLIENFIKNVVAYIRKTKGGKWGVYSESGKLLGEHESKASANKQLRAIEVNKKGQKLAYIAMKFAMSYVFPKEDDADEFAAALESAVTDTDVLVEGTSVTIRDVTEQVSDWVDKNLGDYNGKETPKESQQVEGGNTNPFGVATAAK